MGWRDRLSIGRKTEQRELVWPWPEVFSFLGNAYNFGGLITTMTRDQRELPAPGFTGYANSFVGNAVVFACMGLRMRVFSEARFMYRRLRSGRPGDLFSTPALDILKTPWPNATTGDLLTRNLVYADLGGNAFTRRGSNRQLKVLRPDWVVIVSGSPNDPDSSGWDLDAELLGYLYTPGGPMSGRTPIPLLPNEVAHFCPVPDPFSPQRGMSPLTPLVREIMADSAATAHKLLFFENGATPNMVVNGVPSESVDVFNKWVEAFKEKHEGLEQAYKTIFLGGGADATVVGANLRQMDFKQTQGAGETRIAAAFGTPPVLVGLSEGLQAATYSNYGQARRAFADETMRPTWRMFAGCLASVVPVPGDAELWYDDRDVPFLAEDVKDAAEIQSIQAGAIRQLIDGGFEPNAVVEAVVAGDLNRLKHTGLLSVQLQEPGVVAEPPALPAGEPAQDQNGQVTDAAVSE